MDNLSLFVPLTKVDAAQRLVYGIATAEAVDRSGEVMDYASTKPLYEKWSGDIHKATDGKSYGNLRAMHGKIAAGKVTAIAFNDDAKQIEVCAKVVDDAEWKKVEEGVYTGFSQGGAYVKRWKGDDGVMRYTAEPSEISLVDLPCLPSATFQVLKADGAAETRHFSPEVTVTPPEPSNAEVLKRAQAIGADAPAGADPIALARQQLIDEAAAAALAKAAPAGEAATPAAVETPTDPDPGYGGVEQVWKAKDGTTFAKKADALAHNQRAEAEAAAKTAAAPVLAALAGLTKTLGGEPAQAEPQPQQPAPAGQGPRLIKADLTKGLYEVSRLACLLSEVKGMAQSAAWESAYEGDGSALPGKLKAWLVQGGTLLQDMVAEEMAEVSEGEALEMAAGRLSPDAIGALAKAIGPDHAAAGTLAKAGARNSKADQSKIQAMHDHAVDLGATCSSGAAKAAGGGDLAKVTEALGAMTGERDALQKVMTDQVLPLLKAADERATRQGEELADLRKMVAAQPVPRHLVGRAVTKGHEGGAEPASTDQVQEALAKLTSEQRADLMIKIAQQHPQQLLPAAR